MLRQSFILGMWIAMVSCGFAEDSLRIAEVLIEPSDVVLSDADQSVQFLVTLKMSDGTLRDATRQAQYAATLAGGAGAADGLVAIEGGRLTPKADGAVTVVATVVDPGSQAKMSASASTTIKGFAVERELHFINDIEPVLTKTGCNAGGCHGKASGQNGFRLSLFAFEPKFDYDALVNEAHGRRVFPASPEESLLLKKATGAIVHGGGSRFDEHSEAYRMLCRWIAQGVPYGDEKAPKVDRIEVLPRERLLAGVGEQQLRVVAYSTDGSARDVTRQAEYKAQQPDILKVEPTGLATTLGHTGEGAVMVRYMGQVDVARIAVPFSRGLPAEAYAHFQPKNFVDEHIVTKWKKLGIAPSALCTDEEFLRRASLDSIGTLPTPEEIKGFLADPSPDKRDRLVDRLLERGEYANYWANQWGDLLRVKRGGNDDLKSGTFAFAGWLRTAFAQNMPYDQFVRAILTAQGESAENPPVNWYRHVRNTVAQVNDSSQLFLGTRISCANCHNHPYERITQDDYWGYGAFFSRIAFKRGQFGNEQSVFVKKDGTTRQPRTGQEMKPKGLGGPEYDYVRGEDPRQKLADWLTEPANPYFAKSIANRIWAHYMGVGLVEAVDDMRVTNPPSNPQLLDALAKDLIDNRFDLKQLMATIMKSRAYSLSSTPTDQNKTDRQNYARYTTKRLSAEALQDAIDTLTGSPEKFAGLPLGTRAIELPDESVTNYFLKTFGRSMRETACECEKSYAPNLSQILHLMNSPELQNKIANGNGRLAGLLKAKKTDEEILSEFYLRAFGRNPHPEELKDALALLTAAKDRTAALEDFAWMFLNSKEFLFNH
ncbi:MAG: hypothetical protein QOE70_358 [Chthoniobacter sp.]|nr:hypothetical protein [Chthoniobacter sp.]